MRRQLLAIAGAPGAGICQKILRRFDPHARLVGRRHLREDALRNLTGVGVDRVLSAAGNRRRGHRDCTVASSMSGRAVTRMNTDDDGGSSSVFSSAFCAAAIIVSAWSMMTTRRRPSNGR